MIKVNSGMYTISKLRQNTDRKRNKINVDTWGVG